MSARRLANAVIPDWETAMDTFFRAVEKRAQIYGLDDDDVYEAMVIGYGHEVADSWSEWVSSE